MIILSSFFSLSPSYISRLIDSSVTWGVDFKHKHLTAAVLEAVAIVNAFSSSSFKDAGVVLEAIETGNEPDLYASNGGRPSPYTVS